MHSSQFSSYWSVDDYCAEIKRDIKTWHIMHAHILQTVMIRFWIDLCELQHWLICAAPSVWNLKLNLSNPGGVSSSDLWLPLWWSDSSSAASTVSSWWRLQPADSVHNLNPRPQPVLKSLHHLSSPPTPFCLFSPSLFCSPISLVHVVSRRQHTEFAESLVIITSLRASTYLLNKSDI